MKSMRRAAAPLGAAVVAAGVVAAGLLIGTLPAPTVGPPVPAASPPATVPPPAPAPGCGPESCAAAADRVVAELKTFQAWLDRHDERGFVGEVGWPGPPSGWGSVASAWFAATDPDLWISGWVSGEWWPASHPLAMYAPDGPAGPLTRAQPQAAVLETAGPAAVRGVTLGGPEFGAPATAPRSSFSNRRPGVPGVDYAYPGQASWRFLADRGLSLVRLPLRWERVQPTLGAPLAGGETRRIARALDAAAAAGLGVVLDLHNFGGYYLADDRGDGRRVTVGTADLPAAALADVWQRLASTFGSHPGLAGYGLMNEPAELGGPSDRADARRWEDVSGRAVAAIRTVDAATTVLVPGVRYANLKAFADLHPSPWIDDPAGATRYEVHHYFDLSAAGDYAVTVPPAPPGAGRGG